MREGILKKNEAGRYVIVSDFGSLELTSGDVCDVYIGGVWIGVRVEYTDTGYYMTTNEESFRPFVGMKAKSV